MKRFFARLGRFLWPWGLLKIVLGIIALLIVIYLEEDWRGAHDWAVTKAAWEAKGESFDFNTFIPPPVPDDRNLAALPLFKMESVKEYNGSSEMEPLAVRKATRSDTPTINAPPLGAWHKGELPDGAKIQKIIASDYSIAFPNAKTPPDALTQFNILYPFVADLHTAAVTRPFCRFQQDYTQQQPYRRPVGLITTQLQVSRILALHAILALENNQPALALDDIKLNFLLMSGLKQDPTLIGGLVNVGVFAIDDQAIYDGLVRHAWNDVQLAELQNELSRFDFLANCQFVIRGEIAGFTVPITDYLKLHPDTILGLPSPDQPNPSGITGILTEIFCHLYYTPGWLDQNKVQIVNTAMRSIGSIDPRNHGISPTVADQVAQTVERDQDKYTRVAPWNILYCIVTPSVIRASSNFAQAQVWLDETIIAIALERYRLAHGVYPDSLDALVPACAPAIPHDIFTGEPYRYRLKPDGTFLLYSVGWNQTDDGGKVVFKKDSPKEVDVTQGDWVWPTPK